MTTTIIDIKGQLKTRDTEIAERFKAGDLTGLEAARERSDLIDQVIFQVIENTCGKSCLDRLAVAAVGGYGRAEMAPFSDVDLLFLVPPKDEQSAQDVEKILYGLWDLGLKIGQSTRTVTECITLAKKDATIATALLEARLIFGDAQLYSSFSSRFDSQIRRKLQHWFLSAKLEERDERHERQGNTRFALQPNIKEGKGGLRDLQTLHWIAKFLLGEHSIETFISNGLYTRSQAQKFRKAENFLWTLRFAMHIDASRPDERLTFERQLNVAERLGYKDRAGQRAVERLMQHYFSTAKVVGDLTAILLAALEAEWNQSGLTDWLPQVLPKAFSGAREVEGFALLNGRLSLQRPSQFAEDPVEMIRLFRVAQTEEVNIHPTTLRVVTQNLKRIDRKVMRSPAANALFIDILISRNDPARILRLMNDTGLLGRFILDFGRIVGLMQFDRYHHYTVDEHTIFAIDNLHRLEAGTITKENPLSTELFPLIKSRRALYVAAFLHDIAKGRGGAHEVLGERVARRLCPRFGLSEQETDFAAWLVRNHLFLSQVFSRRDLDDPSTIEEVATVVGSLEYLRCLHILTAADIRAVGPGVWTGWKAQMMRQLFFQTEEYLRGGLIVDGREQRIEAAITAVRSSLVNWPSADVEERVALAFPHYWLSNSTDDIVEQFAITRTADQNNEPLSLDIKIDDKAGDIKLTAYLDDYPGVFSRVAGGISLSGGSIESARVHSFRNGRALQLYSIRAVESDLETLRGLKKRIEQNVPKGLRGAINLAREMAQRRAQARKDEGIIRIPTQVFIDNEASERHTIVEVSGSNMIGALFAMTNAISELGMVINIAKIANYGTRFANVFYVQDLFGARITSEDRLKRLRTAIEDALKAASV